MKRIRLLKASTTIAVCLVVVACATSSESSTAGSARPTTEMAFAKGDPVVKDGGHSLSELLIIDSPSCGIADPAINIAAHANSPGYVLINEIHAGLMRLNTKGVQ